MEGDSVPWKTDQCLLVFVYPEMADFWGMSRGMAGAWGKCLEALG